MEMYQLNSLGEKIKQNTMYESIGLDLTKSQVISFVGSGGKTTSIYHLANELSSLGKRVIITTTTHMFLPTNNVILNEDREQLLDLLHSNKIAVVGTPCSENKITKVSTSFYNWLKTISDYLLVEADGSKRLPLKVPNHHEPVIPPDTNLTIILSGLTALTHPLIDCCHRWQLAADILNCHPTHPVTPIEAAKLINEGYCKKLTPPYKILLNQCTTPEQHQNAVQMIKYLHSQGVSHHNISFGHFF